MTITTDQLTQFRALLKNEEKSAATLNKYLRDIQRFALWLGDTPLERDAMLDYKADLMRHYADRRGLIKHKKEAPAEKQSLLFLPRQREV